MSRFLPIRSALILLAAMLLGTAAHAQSYRMSSRFLARGEKALLEVAVPGMPAPELRSMPEVPGVVISPLGHGVKPTNSRMYEYVFRFEISTHTVGTHTIPPVEVMVAGQRKSTEPYTFSVFNPDELRLTEATLGDYTFRYAAVFRAAKPDPFNGETIPVEIKVYVPRDLPFVDWGIPEFKPDGVTAWRFQPNATRGYLNLLGIPYVAVAYPSTLTPQRTGAIGIGPARVRLTARLFDVGQGIPQQITKEVYAEVPKLSLESKPLPDGAPEGFDNAVGSFKVSSSSEVTEIQEGDPIPIMLEVRGSGNLDTLQAPQPVDSSGWKLYEVTPEPRGEERRDVSGTTRFRLFMRPLEMKTQIPAFKLVYFDPQLQQYQTALTDALPLKMNAAPKVAMDQAAAPQALAVPIERMTDILGVLQPNQLLLPDESPVRPWMWHALAGILALTLIAKAWWMRNRHRFQADPIRGQRLKDLREVENFRGDDHGFLMQAGRFIERWLSGKATPELQAVLSERDLQCFRNDSSPSLQIGAKRRREILDLIRKASLLAVCAVLLGSSGVRAEDTASRAKAAYDAANYEEAANLWLNAGPYEKLSADALYNIGNACYRAGSPGNAALYYRRALVRDPSHAEARQNLRFIERKHGSITVKRPDYQYALAKLPLTSWQGLLWGGLWICVLSILVFPATRDGSRWRFPALIGIIAGPLIAGGGALGWRYYPNDAEFSPVAKQAVIIAEKAVLHADASRTSPDVIDAPPGSLCEIIRETGRWAYVSFATKTRGWIPIEMIEKVVPEKTPEPPKIRKPKADGKSA
jgi:tetratricopeptide (TPR) repeat protein